MNFTFSEKNGQKPISEWLTKNLKSYAEKEHGIKLDVKIKENQLTPETTSKK